MLVCVYLKTKVVAVLILSFASSEGTCVCVCVLGNKERERERERGRERERVCVCVLWTVVTCVFAVRGGGCVLYWEVQPFYFDFHIRRKNLSLLPQHNLLMLFQSICETGTQKFSHFLSFCVFVSFFLFVPVFLYLCVFAHLFHSQFFYMWLVFTVCFTVLQT